MIAGFSFPSTGKCNSVVELFTSMGRDFDSTIKFNASEYCELVYTETVDSVKRARWLARQTPNILHYLPPSNSGQNGALVGVRYKWRNHPN